MNSQKGFKDLPILAILCFTIVFIPLAFLTSAFDVFGTIKYTLLILMALLVLSLLIWLPLATGKIRIPWGWMAVALGGFVVWLALSTLSSPVAEISFFGLRKRLLGMTTYLAAIILFLGAAGISWDKTKLRAILYSACGAVVASSAIGIAQFFGASYPFDLKNLFARSAYSTFGNPNYFGLFLVLVLPITIYLAVDGQNLRDRIIGYISLAAALSGLIATGSSGAFIGAIGGGGAFLVWRYIGNKKINPNLTKMAVAALIALVMAGSIYAVTMEQTAIGQRSWIWKTSLKVAADNPIVGTGLDNLTSGIQKLAVKPEPDSPGFKYEDAHNTWLNLAATAGFPALCLMIAFLTLAALNATSAWRQKKNLQILPVLLASGLGYLLAGQFNPEDLGSMPLFWIWLGILVSVSGQVRTVKFKPGLPARLAAGLLSLAIIAAAVVSSRTLTAEINLLKANNAPNLQIAKDTFKAIQSAQPWQTQYLTLETYRLLPSVTSLKTPTGREVMKAAQKAIAINPKDPENWLALGELYRSVAQRQNSRELHKVALDVFKRAATIDKYNARAIELTALTYKDLGNKQNTLKWIQRYEDSFSKSIRLVDVKLELLNEEDTEKMDKT